MAKVTLEQELWDLDDVLEDEVVNKDQIAISPRNARAKDLPDFNPTAQEPPPGEADTPAVPIVSINVSPRQKIRQFAHVERIGRIPNANRSQPKEERESRQSAMKSGDTVEDTFDDLEQWDGPAPAPGRTLDVDSDWGSDVPSSPPLAEGSRPEPMPVPATPVAPAAPSTAGDEDQDEFTPRAKPSTPSVAAGPKLGFTMVEKLALASLAVVMLGGGAWVYQNTLSRLITSAAATPKVAFPVQGKYATVAAAATYWRAPINTPGREESIRRGVVIIPVTELSLSGGSGAIRVFFRDENGKYVGDAITRDVSGAATLEIPCTDGFDDISMHAAYRTGQIKPWSLQVLEAPSANAPAADFKELFNIPIGSQTR